MSSPILDHSHCHVVYFDERASFDRWIKKDGMVSSVANLPPGTSYFDISAAEPEDLLADIMAIRGVFNQVYVCNTSGAFLSKIAELRQSVGIECTPIIGLVSSDSAELTRSSPPPRSTLSIYSRDTMTPSPASFRRTLTREFSSSPEPEDLYGLRLVARVHSDVESESGPKVVMPVALIRLDSASTPTPGHGRGPSATSHLGELGDGPSRQGGQIFPGMINPITMRRCLEAGAMDVLSSPLDPSRVFGLTSHAYRVHKEAHKTQSVNLTKARTRKQSWVGVNEEKPYAYMREAMVSKLMAGICNPEDDETTFRVQELPSIEDSRDEEVAAVIGHWNFCSHDFSEDELVHAGSLMLDHVLKMPELQNWRISFDQLKKFLTASRNAYNSFVLYHNFKHAVDVLQSSFYFLLQIGTIPPYPPGTPPTELQLSKSPIAALLTPFDALTLLISAIGHDVGHPGVNNMFLVKLNAPLAQLYNDNSVLEAFHCAAFSQILRRFWPVAFEDRNMRKLMISNILATDMGVHFKYMSDCGNLQEKLHENRGVDGWSPQVLATYRTLTCGLLIKCADISNVTRPWEVAERWTNILQLEFSKQGEMEREVGMETALVGGPPEVGNLVKLARGQIGFMNTFAYPLFESVTDLLPPMGFAVKEIEANRVIWVEKVEQQKNKHFLRTDIGYTDSGFVSPRSQSPVRKLQQYDGADDYAPPTSTPPRLASEYPPSSRDSRRSSLASISHFVTGSTPKDQSRRSSLQSPFGLPPVVSTTPEMTSRRSSGAFPGANPVPPPQLQPRRSSNTVPSSQLHLNEGRVDMPIRNGPIATVGGESDATPRAMNADPNVFAALVLTRSGPNGMASAAPDIFSEESSSRRNDSRTVGRTPPYRNGSAGRISLPSSSSHTRDSQTTSGTRALSSVVTPVSPSTQATSFLTVDSDDKSLQHADSRPQSSSMPSIPSKFDSERGRREEDKNAVRTSVMGNGTLPEGSRSVPRRRSRLRLAFWRRKPSSSDSVS